MKAASAVFKESDFMQLQNNQDLVKTIKDWLNSCVEENVDVVVFPGLIGCIYGDSERYLDAILGISMEYKDLYICPGSYFEVCEEKTYHSSCIIANGQICLAQRQLYLAKWEKALGLSRGTKASFLDINGMKTALLLSADMFYPQVSRHLALSGVDLVLAPSAIKEGGNMALQLSGLWQNVQQNLFFGIESGFKGRLYDCEFFSRSVIHGPLEMTDKSNGFIKFERNNSEADIIAAELDNKKRIEAIKKFDTLAQLNIDIYKDIFR